MSNLNRYNGETVWAIETVDGVDVLVSFRQTYLEDSIAGSIKHTIRSGETFQDIALRYYAAPELWYVIADANPEIFYPGSLDGLVGATITVPPPSYAAAQ